MLSAPRSSAELAGRALSAFGHLLPQRRITVWTRPADGPSGPMHFCETSCWKVDSSFEPADLFPAELGRHHRRFAGCCVPVLERLIAADWPDWQLTTRHHVELDSLPALASSGVAADAWPDTFAELGRRLRLGDDAADRAQLTGPDVSGPLTVVIAAVTADVDASLARLPAGVVLAVRRAGADRAGFAADIDAEAGFTVGSVLENSSPGQLADPWARWRDAIVTSWLEQNAARTFDQRRFAAAADSHRLATSPAVFTADTLDQTPDPAALSAHIAGAVTAVLYRYRTPAPVTSRLVVPADRCGPSRLGLHLHGAIRFRSAAGTMLVVDVPDWLHAHLGSAAAAASPVAGPVDRTVVQAVFDAGHPADVILELAARLS